MKILIVYIIVIFVLSSKLIAQYNYVPNYSFEQYDTCPNGRSYLTPSCDNWFSPISKMQIIPQNFSLNNWGSSDYFNSCSTADVQVPSNSLGYQQAKIGKAYSGIFILYNSNTIINDFKEYIEVPLKKNLTKDKTYCLEFYYSIAERFCSNPNNYYPIKLGALLTDTIVSRLSGINTQQPQNIYANPQISQQLPQIIDTINWIKVSGSFIAKGGEHYLTIGNFQHTDTLTDKNVYVYIDVVKLYYCGPDTTPHPTDSMIIPNIFTPNGDSFNDKFEYKYQKQWEFETQIFNRWGNLVFDNKNSENWDGTYQGKPVTSGVYFYIIKALAIKTGEIRIYRGTVTVMY